MSALLRQPGGFEGFLSIKKDPYKQELAVFEVVEVRKRLYLWKAALGLHIQYQERQNAVVPKRPQPLDLNLESRRPLIDGLEKVPDPRFTTVWPLDSRKWVDQLKIGVTEGEVRVNVPVVDGGNSPAHDLDVLLWHRPRIIAPCLRQQRHGFHLSTDKPEGLALPLIEVAG